LVDQVQPNIVLMDIILPGLGGIQATRQIRHKHPNVQVIAMTSSPDPTLMPDTLQGGAG
jgi:DNA-binding NarL/FixJ family response regulator